MLDIWNVLADAVNWGSNPSGSTGIAIVIISFLTVSFFSAEPPANKEKAKLKTNNRVIISNVSVDNEFSKYKENGYYVLKIDSATETFTEVKKYIIKYTIVTLVFVIIIAIYFFGWSALMAFLKSLLRG